MGAGKKVWGYHPAGNVWLPLTCNGAGQLIVDMTNVDLGDLGDVNVVGVVNLDVLQWNAAAGEWQVVAPGAMAGAINLGDLADVDTVGAINFDVIRWNNVAGEWQVSNIAIALNGLLTVRGDIIRRGAAFAERYALGAVGQRLEAGALDPAWAWPDSLQNVGGDILTSTAAGIVTTPRQAGAGAYLSANQLTAGPNIPTQIKLDTAIFDVQGELNLNQVVSAATAGTGGVALFDATNPFVLGDVGKSVWNDAIGGSTTIAAFVAANQVTLTVGIGLVAGSAYTFGYARYTVTVAGLYLIVGGVIIWWVDVTAGQSYWSRIYRNGVPVGGMIDQAAINGIGCGSATVMLYNMNVGDYIQLWTVHTDAMGTRARGGIDSTYLHVAKIA